MLRYIKANNKWYDTLTELKNGRAIHVIDGSVYVINNWGEIDDYLGEFEEDTDTACCICGQPYTGYGNNAEPYAEGRCCDECNLKYVIPSRLDIKQ